MNTDKMLRRRDKETKRRSENASYVSVSSLRLSVSSSLRLTLFIFAPFLASAVSGCQSASAPRQPTIQQAALNRWNDTRADVLLSLADDQYKNGAFDKCRQTLIEALKLDPNQPEIHILSAKLFIEQGQLDMAEKDLDAARSSDPHGAEEDYLSGIIFQRWQQPDQAQAYYDSACQKSPTELAYLLAKAEMMVDQGHPAQALALLQSRITYFEHSAAIRDAAGILLIQQGQPQQAVEMLRRASILAPDDQTIREHLARALFENHLYVESAVELTHLLHDPNYASRPDLYLTLGACQLQMQRLGDARLSFEQACTLDPTSLAAGLALARVQIQLGDLRAADYTLHRVYPETIDTPSGDYDLLLGYLRLRQNQLNDALAAFSQANQLNPTDTVSLCMVGYVLQQQHRADQATRFFKAALRISPNDELARTMLAQAAR